jgi:hypothetical protein
MPVQVYPDLAISSTEPDNDVAWMMLVLSPSPISMTSHTAPCFPLDYGAGHPVEPERPATSFRLQILRAWHAVCGGDPAEAPGHA